MGYFHIEPPFIKSPTDNIESTALWAGGFPVFPIGKPLARLKNDFWFDNGSLLDYL
jgi:hypothetical protein